MILTCDQKCCKKKGFAVSYHLIDTRFALLSYKLLNVHDDPRLAKWNYTLPNHDDGFSIDKLYNFLTVINDAYGQDINRQKQIRSMVDAIFKDFYIIQKRNLQIFIYFYVLPFLI